VDPRVGRVASTTGYHPLPKNRCKLHLRLWPGWTSRCNNTGTFCARETALSYSFARSKESLQQRVPAADLRLSAAGAERRPVAEEPSGALFDMDAGHP
jgi:hypothetical protein